MRGEGIQSDERSGQHVALVTLREAYERGAPLDGGKGREVTGGMKELRGRQRPVNHRSPRDAIAT